MVKDRSLSGYSSLENVNRNLAKSGGLKKDVIFHSFLYSYILCSRADSLCTLACDSE